jgi:hypothetical protein
MRVAKYLSLETRDARDQSGSALAIFSERRLAISKSNKRGTVQTSAGLFADRRPIPTDPLRMDVDATTFSIVSRIECYATSILLEKSYESFTS